MHLGDGRGWGGRKTMRRSCGAAQMWTSTKSKLSSLGTMSKIDILVVKATGSRMLVKAHLTFLYLGILHLFGFCLTINTAVWLRFFSMTALSSQTKSILLHLCIWKQCLTRGLSMSVSASEGLKMREEATL